MPRRIRPAAKPVAAQSRTCREQPDRWAAEVGGLIGSALRQVNRNHSTGTTQPGPLNRDQPTGPRQPRRAWAVSANPAPIPSAQSPRNAWRAPLGAEPGQLRAARATGKKRKYRRPVWRTPPPGLNDDHGRVYSRASSQQPAGGGGPSGREAGTYAVLAPVRCGRLPGEDAVRRLKGLMRLMGPDGVARHGSAPDGLAAGYLGGAPCHRRIPAVSCGRAIRGGPRACGGVPTL